MKTSAPLFVLMFTIVLNFNATAQRFSLSNTTEAAINHVNIKADKIAIEKKANGVLIKWQTTVEKNTSLFELQFSFDNEKFETIKKVAASDVTQWLTAYEVKSTKTYLSKDKVFYRLRTLFNDGSEEFSSTSSFEIKNEKNETNYLIIN